MTRDALIARNLPPSLGQSNPATPTTSGTRFENIGEVQNSGFEVALNARIIDSNSLGWTVRVSGATLKNEIVRLGEGIDPILVNRGMQKHVEGYSAGAFWQAPITINDANNDGLLTLTEYAVGDTAEYIGPSLPTRIASLNSEPLATGIEARLIVAEAALQAGNRAAFFSAHNALRATAGLSAFTDSGQAQASLVDLHFRERAFWLHSTGHRLGDLRRLIRQYNRTANTVFPSGTHHKGTPYGSDVNFPIPVQEDNNPNVAPLNQGCINRSA